MPRGRRLLTPEKERQLLAEVSLRDQLTNKAIAARLGLTAAQLENILHRLRWQLTPCEVNGKCHSEKAGDAA
jgi:transposase